MPHYMKKGLLSKVDSLADAAKWIGVTHATLTETLAQYVRRVSLPYPPSPCVFLAVLPPRVSLPYLPAVCAGAGCGWVRGGGDTTANIADDSHYPVTSPTPPGVDAFCLLAAGTMRRRRRAKTRLGKSFSTTRNSPRRLARSTWGR